MKQKELEASLSPDIQGFYKILQSFVAGGNCVSETGDKVRRMQSVELAEVHGKVVGFVFTT